MTQPVDYDEAAGAYAANRRVHGGVFQELARHIEPGPATSILEVGCGTGNYAGALAGHRGCTTYGLDPSAGMLVHARAQPERIGWLLGQAEHLPFTVETFDLIYSVDVIHHVADKAIYFHEAIRCLRAEGQVCTVTDSEEMIRRREILSGYFPETVAFELDRYPRIAEVKAWMVAAGLVALNVVDVEEPYEVASAQPFRDKAYSSLHLIPEDAWRRGLSRLEHDLAHGPVRGVARYTCVWGQKPAD